MPIAATLASLENCLRNNRAARFASLRPGIDADGLARLAKKLTHAVPDDLAMLLAWHNGANSDGEDLFENYRLMNASEIGDGAGALGEHLSSGELDDKIDWWVNGWIPFLDNGAGDWICVDTVGSFGGNAGQLVEFFHDDDRRNVIAPSLDAWLAALTTAFEKHLADDDAELRAHFATTLTGYPKLAAARKNEVKTKARISVRDAIKNAVHPLDGPVKDLAIEIAPDKVVKAAKLEVADACATLAKRRESAKVHVFEIFAAPKTKKIAYAVWSTSTVGENWKDGYVVGIDLKGDTVLKEKKVAT